MSSAAYTHKPKHTHAQGKKPKCQKAGNKLTFLVILCKSWNGKR